MVSNKRLARLVGVLVLGALSCVPPATAKTFCCTDAAGRRLCGDTLPPQCANQTYRYTNEKGITTQVDAPLTPEQRAKKEAEEAKKREEERLASVQRLRDQALLNTYAGEKDIDVVRDRALADMTAATKQIQDKYDAALKRKQQLESEKEFYAKKPMPENLKSQIKENEVEIQAQKKALDDKAQETAAVRQRFEDEKKRYLELKYGKDGAPSAAPGAAARPR